MIVLSNRHLRSLGLSNSFSSRLPACHYPTSIAILLVLMSLAEAFSARMSFSTHHDCCAVSRDVSDTAETSRALSKFVGVSEISVPLRRCV